MLPKLYFWQKIFKQVWYEPIEWNCIYLITGVLRGSYTKYICVVMLYNNF